MNENLEDTECVPSSPLDKGAPIKTRKSDKESLWIKQVDSRLAGYVRSSSSL